MTAFISAALDYGESSDLSRRIACCEVQHIFLTELFGDWDWFSGFLLVIIDGLPVTVARWGVGGGLSIEEVFARPEVAARVSLMVRADDRARWVALLRPGDQVSVGLPYDLLTFSVRDGVRTTPDQYKDDVLPEYKP